MTDYIAPIPQSPLPPRAWTASRAGRALPKMLPAKALIARRSWGAACSPGLATGMFTTAPLDVIRVIPTQRFKGTLQSRETTCREPFATMIIAAASKLPDQIFHNASKISHLSPLHSVRVLLDPEERLEKRAPQAFVIAGMRRNFGDVTARAQGIPRLLSGRGQSKQVLVAHVLAALFRYRQQILFQPSNHCGVVFASLSRPLMQPGPPRCSQFPNRTLRAAAD